MHQNWKHRLTAGLLALLLAVGFALAGLPNMHAAISAEAAVQVKLNKTKASLYVGDTVRLKLTGTTAKKATWSTSNKSVAIVSRYGTVKGKKKGTAVITVKAGNKTYSCKITVKNRPVTSISIKLDKTMFYPGEQYTAKCTLRPAAATIRTVTYSSSNPKVASISKRGVITTVAPGKTVITASSHNGLTSSVSITVAEAPVLSLAGKSITLGCKEEDLISIFGEPDRTGRSSFGDTTYIYNGDYTHFLMLYMKDGAAAGFYTDAADFSFRNIRYGAAYDPKAVSEDPSLNISVLWDQIGDRTVTGIRVIRSELTPNKKTDETITNQELEILDLTNSIRVRGGMEPLLWSEQAHRSAKLHSEDMKERNFFDHINPDGQSPFDRMEQVGISYYSAGENIAQGYFDSVAVTFAWFQSVGHRSNLLDSGFRYLGVGIDDASGSYYTQNFYSD